MGQLFLDGDPPIEIRLKKHPRSRRLSLRVSRLDGVVSMSMPRWTAKREAMAFAREKEDWIRSQLSVRREIIVPTVGGSVLFEGAEVPIRAGRRRSVGFEAGEIVVPGDGAHTPVRLAAFLKIMARERLSAACDGYADALGARYQRLTMRDTRSRWGSCSAAGNLMFSWRLIMAPPEVLDYVAAHEVAHLREMNHSLDFWALVEQISPHYRRPRQWLRQNGGVLHAYRFGN